MVNPCHRIACGLALSGALSAAAAGGLDALDALEVAARQGCVRAATDYPARDKPPPGFPPCDAFAVYYGLGRPVDDVQARRCAFATPEYGVLAMLYANGKGVARNYALARKAVCDDHDAAPAETQGRLEHIDRMERDPAQAAQGFDFCDDATSGASTGWCAHLQAERARTTRDARLDALSASWPAPQRAAFADLRRALQAWVEARGGEVDKSGTARAALTIAEEEDQRDAFVDLVARAEAGRVRALAPARAQALDAQMNATWARLKATPDGGGTTVTMTDILAAQRAWLKYRDAWVRLAAQRWPALPTPTWAALLTEQREKELEDLLRDRTP